MVKLAAWRGPENFFPGSRGVNVGKSGNPAPAQV